MKALAFFIPFLIIHGSQGASLERRVVAYINVFRHLHGVPPLVMHPLIANEAKLAAKRYMQSGKAGTLNSKYNANYCTYSGLESELPQTCAVLWYTTVKHHIWCRPSAAGKASPFVNMIWVPSINVGIGMAKNSAGKVYLVAFFSPGGDQKVTHNVPPVRVVKDAGPKAKCPPGFTRFATSCYRYHPTPVSWDDALIHCAKQNATLVSVRDSEEEKFVRGMQKDSSNPFSWIGLRDAFQEGRYSWVDGLLFKRDSCVPINAGGGYSENCVAWTTKKPVGCWSDRVCAEKLPFTCRKPVEGKASYRVEILFKRKKWNPKLADPKSKTFKDFAKGLVITLKEIFTRARSGKKAKGFRKVNVKSLRPMKYSPQKPPGVAVLLSIKFRTLSSDPTLKFQKFLRPSEKLLHMVLEMPGVSHVLSRVSQYSFCAGACHAHYNQAQMYCNNPYTYQQIQSSYCPLSCSSSTAHACPSYCHTSCCTATSTTQTSPGSYAATGTSPSSYLSSYSSPYPSSYYPNTAALQSAMQYTSPAQTAVGAATSSYCPATCSQTNPYCQTYCDEECCQENPTKEHLEKLMSKMRGNIARLKGLLGNMKNDSSPQLDEMTEFSSGSEESGQEDSDSYLQAGCSSSCLKTPSNSCSKNCSSSCCAKLLKVNSMKLIESMESKLNDLEEKYNKIKANSETKLEEKYEPLEEMPTDKSTYTGPLESSEEFGAYVEKPAVDPSLEEAQNQLAETSEKEFALENENDHQANENYYIPSLSQEQRQPEAQNKTYDQRDFESFGNRTVDTTVNISNLTAVGVQIENFKDVSNTANKTSVEDELNSESIINENALKKNFITQNTDNIYQVNSTKEDTDKTAIGHL